MSKKPTIADNISSLLDEAMDMIKPVEPKDIQHNHDERHIWDIPQQDNKPIKPNGIIGDKIVNKKSTTYKSSKKLSKNQRLEKQKLINASMCIDREQNSDEIISNLVRM